MRIFDALFGRRKAADSSSLSGVQGDNPVSAVPPAQRHVADPRELGLRPEISPTPPRVISGTVAEKAELASWMISMFIKQGSVSLPFVLERMLDFRFCSLCAYYLSLEMFSSYGVTFCGEAPEIVRALGYNLETMLSGRVADVGQTASLITPGKYRGYGNPINSPRSMGHLFQINLCAFVEKKPVIGYQDWQGNPLIPFKGMTPCGVSGSWQLFELDPAKTDDMTAVFINPSRAELQIELAHFVEGEEKPRMFYRFSSIRGTAVEDHSKDVEVVN